MYFLGLDPAQSIKSNTLYAASIKSRHDPKGNCFFHSFFLFFLFFLLLLCSSQCVIFVDADVLPVAWAPLLNQSWTYKLNDNLSKEEQLLRERMRIGATGIASFQFDEDSSLLLFPFSGSLFLGFVNEVLFFFST